MKKIDKNDFKKWVIGFVALLVMASVALLFFYVIGHFLTTSNIALFSGIAPISSSKFLNTAAAGLGNFCGYVAIIAAACVFLIYLPERLGNWIFKRADKTESR